MSLLPIIYTSVLIFASLVTTVLLISYIIYRIKGGAPKPASIMVNQPNIQATQRRPVSRVNSSNMNYRSNRVQNHNTYYKKPVSVNKPSQISRKTSGPRLQVLNKPTEKKIVVVRKSNSNTAAENFLNYYEGERRVFVHA